MHEKTVIMDENAMTRAIARISYEILERNKGAENLCLVGILSRGVILANRIAAKLGELEKTEIPCGILDITPYRDDIVHKEHYFERTNIHFSLQEQNLIICDDVIYTGRSIRAALDAIISRGRPRAIQLAVLVDRGHRELPIRPDYIGKNVPTSRDEIVKVCMREIDGCDMVMLGR